MMRQVLCRKGVLTLRPAFPRLSALIGQSVSSSDSKFAELVVSTTEVQRLLCPIALRLVTLGAATEMLHAGFPGPLIQVRGSRKA